MVDATHAPRRLACRLDGRQEERDQGGDDGDCYQEFDKREASASQRITPFSPTTRTRPWGWRPGSRLVLEQESPVNPRTRPPPDRSASTVSARDRRSKA